MRKIVHKVVHALGFEAFRLQRSYEQTLTLHLVEHSDQVMHFLVDNPHDAVQKHHANGKLYEPEECALIDRYFQGGVFVDVGANVGNHSVFFGKLQKTDLVIAFEPNPLIHPILCANIEYNGLSEKFKLYRLALSDGEGEISLHIPAQNMGAASFSGIRDGRKTERTVKAHRAMGDAIIEKTKIDFLKIDVEGHEVECINGLKDTILANRPPIFIEVSPKDRTVLEALLASLGYVLQAEYSRYDTSTNLLLTHG